ncbi:unnamed protein product [Euphydryas editha]|uniref:NADP-dependent oxidoreductase domain-containing protein n=1 Tax=Euphydryas editha TaxID=104508 RepID=A0AAU9UU02_EUPED|nr:unnamed protein product [Euphydryas editha]
MDEIKCILRNMQEEMRQQKADMLDMKEDIKNTIVSNMSEKYNSLEEGEELLPLDNEAKVIPSPVDYVDTWKAMEKLVDLGLTKSIGLSNFNKKQIDRVMEVARIKPASLQIEVHPYLNQVKLIDYARFLGITVTAYAPLGSPDRPWAEPDEPRLLEDPLLKTIGKKHNKSPAQILIRYAIDRGLIVIPKSVTKSRIIQNFNVFDFQLTAEDMKTIGSLECNRRLCTLGE